ncbi:mannitol dehydrogenase family protein [Vibrio zhugei]|uniref:Mannitol dehydrogenase family protein n=1 Tax=Vibrio zhugei TaxID=2479546 RepID=A0ABV7CA12_9VIBR|nr:fructuronate reductase [Vibrio zhugei]
MNTIANTSLNPLVQRPRYDRSKLKPHIVHIGCGAFHRAHQALYTHLLAEQTSCDWGICEVSLFSGDPLFSDLANQDELYTVLEQYNQQQSAQCVGTIVKSVSKKRDGTQAIIEQLANVDTRIVSLTITEKGYCIDAASGELDLANAAIAHDLQSPHDPDSAIGYIVEGLAHRRQLGLEAYTVLSCDNIQGNGHVLRHAVLQYAKAIDPQLAQWIEQHASFPCTMVDRIVPAATQDSLHLVERAIGVYDPCAIACESFKQWVIEDDFVQGRPDWDKVGAQFVDDVTVYEAMKLRMLNGSHSFLAYLGVLAGYQYIADCMDNPDIYRCVQALMLNVQAPTLTVTAELDLNAYAEQLLERFCNRSIYHRTQQIAMDGSQKIAYRLVNSLRYHLDQHNDIRLLATGIAAWIRYTTATDDRGNTIDVVDPLKDRLNQIYQQYGTGVDVIPHVLALDAIFPRDIGHHPSVLDAVSQAYQSLIDHGAKQTIAHLAEAL